MEEATEEATEAVVKANIHAQKLQLRNLKALLAEAKRKRIGTKRGRQAKAQDKIKADKAKERLSNKVANLINDPKLVDRLTKNLESFARARYMDHKHELSLPAFYAASRYIPYVVWQKLCEYEDLLSQTQESLGRKFFVLQPQEILRSIQYLQTIAPELASLLEKEFLRAHTDRQTNTDEALDINAATDECAFFDGNPSPFDTRETEPPITTRTTFNHSLSPTPKPSPNGRQSASIQSPTSYNPQQSQHFHISALQPNQPSPPKRQSPDELAEHAYANTTHNSNIYAVPNRRRQDRPVVQNYTWMLDHGTSLPQDPDQSCASNRPVARNAISPNRISVQSSRFTSFVSNPDGPSRIVELDGHSEMVNPSAAQWQLTNTNSPVPLPITNMHSFCRDGNERRLMDFFVNKYCPEQTLYTDPNNNSILKCIPAHPPKEFMAAIYLISSLYLKDGNEVYYFQTVVTYLREMIEQPTLLQSRVSVIIGIIRLLVQYSVVKSNRDQSWVFHLKGVAYIVELTKDPTWNSFIRIAYESIVKFVPNIENDYKPNNGMPVGRLLEFDDPKRILDIGCSAQVLYFLGMINVVDSIKNPDERTSLTQYLTRCHTEIEQTTSEEDEIKRDCILKTAESYKHLLLVLILLRLTNSDLSTAGDTLASCILEISIDDNLLTAQFPLAPAFWAMILSNKYGQDCCNLMGKIWNDRPSNTKHAVEVARLARERLWGKAFERHVIEEVVRDVMKDMNMKELSLS